MWKILECKIAQNIEHNVHYCANDFYIIKFTSRREEKNVDNVFFVEFWLEIKELQKSPGKVCDR